MKKYVKIFAAVAVILAGVIVTGCGAAQALIEQIEATYDTWYKYNGTLNIPLGNSDATESDTKLDDLKNAEVFVYFNKEDGLKVAVQATSVQDVELLNGWISTTQDVHVGGTKTFDSFDSIKWTLLIESGKFTESSEPEISSGTGTCIQLIGDDNSQNITIQWKKVLKNYLVNLAFPD